MMGKSASGKDSLREELLADGGLGLKPLVIYTTRPIRADETDGVEYHFVDEECMRRMEQAGSVIELRTYHTVQGPWYYFTADNEEIRLARNNYLALGTLESCRAMRRYYGEDKVVPIYLEVEDGERLERALSRERAQAAPAYEEMCRRFLADQTDFSEERLREAGITRRFSNNGSKEQCMREITEYIRQKMIPASKAADGCLRDI